MLARGISLFNIGRQPKDTQVKNTIRDGSSTALYTDHTVYNVYTVYTTQIVSRCLNISMYAYVYCYKVRTLLDVGSVGTRTDGWLSGWIPL